MPLTKSQKAYCEQLNTCHRVAIKLLLALDPDLGEYSKLYSIYNDVQLKCHFIRSCLIFNDSAVQFTEKEIKDIEEARKKIEQATKTKAMINAGLNALGMLLDTATKFRGFGLA